MQESGLNQMQANKATSIGFADRKGEFGMSVVCKDLTTAQLLKVAADYNAQRLPLSDDERLELIDLIKQRAAEELEYGQEIECETVRVVRRVTGAVGVFFKS